MSLAPTRAPISVLDRYIAGQLTGPFIFGVAAFTSILVSVGAVFDLIRQMTEMGLPLSIATRVFLLRLPEFASLSFPMATLLSTLMVYSRLSTDSELIALRSVGISIYRLVAPAIVLSFLVSVMTFGFNEAIVPAAKYQATQTLSQALKQDKPKFDEKNIVFQQYRDEKQPDGKSVQMLDRIFYAQRFDGQQMKGLTVLDFSQNGVNQIISADSARWNYEDQTWDFFSGTIYLVDPNASYRNILKFERQQIQLPRTPLDLATHKTDSAEMNIAEVQDYLQLVNQSGDEKRANQLRMRIQQKIAFPFVCLVFGLAGSTLGTKPRRGGRGASFAISILIIFTYYLLSFVCDAFGRLEIFTPILAAWLPTVLGLGAVSWLLVRAAK
ncbi:MULTISPECIES: LptF/LptG family permease [Leptolyngbya]|jgi:lipopolysaccharide export system permease protein|uniref:LptF/LptG family permease n=2 Tax=Leptolyngbya boryana TaxID=1184 RepID=A0AA97AX19_LEPBY|nr:MULTISPECIES: LptF/LptG family permease [Leptolyngbya]BAY53551.1 putative permease [Leptolyngbya boryana NIES-2135]MBD1855729.1 LptF/LptG family permease [Leptolyngbya sp. FACHB-1624]MBD2366589.1 LptF/LptG family permease [Leptolyngbya sp. FACHB-161]MBD2373398.1 LptF/LptG family permease [Leptolyngbya sp. FACHB-238]MBD2397797.1 LptF/LptG family permease [Leptolyngbya sp. FACHB-239]